MRPTTSRDGASTKVTGFSVLGSARRAVTSRPPKFPSGAFDASTSSPLLTGWALPAKEKFNDNVNESPSRALIAGRKPVINEASFRGAAVRFYPYLDFLG